jgi:hypothetical protein
MLHVLQNLKMGKEELTWNPKGTTSLSEAFATDLSDAQQHQ